MSAKHSIPPIQTRSGVGAVFGSRGEPLPEVRKALIEDAPRLVRLHVDAADGSTTSPVCCRRHLGSR